MLRTATIRKLLTISDLRAGNRGYPRKKERCQRAKETTDGKTLSEERVFSKA